MAPALSHVIPAVSEMGRARRFWEDVLGFSGEGEGAFRFLDAGGARIALNERPGGDPGAASSTTEVVLEVDEPQATYEAWESAGVPFEVALRPVMSHGGRHLLAAHFRDPDGHLVSLTGWEDE